MSPAGGPTGETRAGFRSYFLKMNPVIRVTAVLTALLIGTVGGGIAADEAADRWAMDVAARGLNPDDVINPFVATPEMRRWAEEQVEGRRAAGPVKQLKALQQALFDRDTFQFEYDDALTLNAEDAFRIRRGNCMSFTALFISLGRSLDIPVDMVSVQKVPDVARVDGLVIVNRHVVAGYRGPGTLTLFDFYVTSSAPPVHQYLVSDVLASAMVHANLGGMDLREGDVDSARRNFTIATTLAPDWAPGWVNLGVVEYRENRTEQALRAYRRALEAEPSNSSALTNLAAIYRDQGDEAASTNALKAAARETRNPFTLIALADIEIHGGRLGRARSYLRRARWWFSSEPEVYLAMARLALAEGDHQEALQLRDRAEKLVRRRAREESDQESRSPR